MLSGTPFGTPSIPPNGPTPAAAGLVRRWLISEDISPTPSEVDAELSDYPPFFRKLLFHRGICTKAQAWEFLEPQAECGDPFDMLGMKDAVKRLEWAIENKESIVVYGDYDVDGVTATALMIQALTKVGATVKPYIPNRFEEGYGLNVEAIEKLSAEGARLILTVDCGIRSFPEAVRAEELDIDLIISDHHQPLPEIPDAYLVICPKQAGDNYPYKDLAGVGIAYKIAQALLSDLPELGVDARDWLDLVALGTVADLAPLTGENRALVKQGLELLRQGKRSGLFSLAQVAGVKLVEEIVSGEEGATIVPRLNITTGDIGYMLGPRLNAAGRVETARDALNLLLAERIEEAGFLAQRLNNQNSQRQEQTRRMQDQADELARKAGNPHILLAFHPDFNEGILGLAAARLADRYYRPVIVGKQGEEFTRASCRSIREFHITQALDECRSLMERHGGHAMAAGFTIRTSRLPELVDRLTEIAERELGQKDLQPVLQADVEIPLNRFEGRYFNSMMNWLEQLQPTGQGNPDAVFVSRNLKVRSKAQVGSEKQHLKLKVSDGLQTFDAIAFQQGHYYPSLPDRVDLMFTLEWNYYGGMKNIQLKVKDVKPAGRPD